MKTWTVAILVLVDIPFGDTCINYNKNHMKKSRNPCSSGYSFRSIILLMDRGLWV